MGPEQALEKRDGAVLTRVAGIPGGLGTVYYLEGTKRWLGGPGLQKCTIECERLLCERCQRGEFKPLPNHPSACASTILIVSMTRGR